VGDGKLKAAVVDAGPLIHLAEIGCFRLLRAFSTLWVPHAVWLETAEHKHLFQNDLSKEPNIRQYSVPQSELAQFVRENNLTELHAGERECLYLCRQKGITTLLTDDLAVRDVARRLKLIPVGSLGIVVMAHKRKEISLLDAERYIADLYDVSSLFVTRDIADLAIEQLRKHPKP
jgi:predicted nucleic acid-binding protein